MIHCRLGRRPRNRPLLRAALLLLAGGAAGAQAQVPWPDFEGRIQYAFYTEDLRALGALQAELAAMPADGWRDYYLALTDYRLDRLQAAGDARAAEQAAAECVTSLRDALRLAPESVEFLALQAGCMDDRARLRPIDLPFTAARAHAQLRRAVRLAPSNPRALLLLARQDREHPASVQDRARALGEAQQAVAAFEKERLGPPAQPGWGLPEAYVELARGCLQGGDALAARSALEHALLMAPDFLEAHRLLKRITS